MVILATGENLDHYQELSYCYKTEMASLEDEVTRELRLFVEKARRVIEPLP